MLISTVTHLLRIAARNTLVGAQPISAFLVVLTLTFTCGCPKTQSTPSAPAASKPAEPRASVALRVLVVNEPDLAEAINRLRGEWAERSGGELSATATTWKHLSTAKTLDADVVLFPSRYLGELCTRNWLRPIRASVLDSETFKGTDIFPLIRSDLMKWGGQIMALPLGVDRAAITPPTTPGVISLLSLASPNAISNERLGVLFDVETMKPRLTEPAIVEALTQLAEKTIPPSDRPTLPILGHSDRLMGVTTFSRNAASAFSLIEWLAQPETSTQFARLDGGVLPARISLASSPAWFDPQLTASQRAELRKSLIAGLSGEKSFAIPRIPGIDEYLEALDAAVKSAVADNVPPADALQKAADKWEQITEAHGRDAQRDAYQKHLGISDK